MLTEMLEIVLTPKIFGPPEKPFQPDGKFAPARKTH